MPSQQSSFRGTRTVFTPCQDAMEATEASSEGPSKMPKFCTQAYSVPERLTPWSWIVEPPPSPRGLPEAGADGGPGGVGGGGGGGGELGRGAGAGDRGGAGGGDGRGGRRGGGGGRGGGGAGGRG